MAFRDTKTKKVIAKGIEWLLKQQHPDGSWNDPVEPAGDAATKPVPANNSPHKHGITGLATLVLLAEADPTHRAPIQAAVNWMIGQVDKSGKVSEATHDGIYSQAICALALAEARLHLGIEDAALVRAIQCILDARNRGAAWRYQPQDGYNDTSVTSWCVAALVAAHEAGIHVPAPAIGEACGYVRAMTDDQGRIGYQNPGENSARHAGEHLERFPPALSCAMTAAGLHAMMCALPDTTMADAKSSIGIVLATPPNGDPRARDYYSWFHGAQALAHLKSTETANWFSALDANLGKLQTTKGDHAGSWEPDDVWGEDAGRTGSTCLALLSLQARYRVHTSKREADFAQANAVSKVRELIHGNSFGLATQAQQEIDIGSLTESDRNAEWVAQTLLARNLASTLLRINQLEQRKPADWIAVAAALEKAAKDYRGGKEGEALERRLLALQENREAKPHLESWQKLQAIKARIGKRRLTPESPIVAQLRQLVADYPATRASQEAQVLIQAAASKNN